MRPAQGRYAMPHLKTATADTHLWVAIMHEPKTQETKMNLIRNYRNWRRYRDTVSELSRLSNRELNDLGITRASIREVARKAI